MKIYGLLTKTGTCAAETMLCEQHMNREAVKMARAQADKDVSTAARFVDVTLNGMAECIVCGGRP